MEATNTLDARVLVESAFAMLPEMVAGYGFQKVRREANATGSFAFSLLNALHAKNVVDPIQRIQMEQHYATKRVPLPQGGSRRHCDIFLDYGGSKIGTSALGNYGWRYLNYVEAKFLRSYSRTKSGQDTRSSANSAEIVADLIRLVALVPEPQINSVHPDPKTSTARYFLCLSDRQPEIFVNQYLRSLHSVFSNPPKHAAIDVDLTTGKAAGAFSGRVGAGFNSLNLSISHATCFAHYPLDPTSENSIWMLLLRLDAASIEYQVGGQVRRFSFGSDRSLTQANVGDYAAIRDFVAQNVR
jgi:hypothetical protein